MASRGFAGTTTACRWSAFDGEGGGGAWTEGGGDAPVFIGDGVGSSKKKTGEERERRRH